MNTTNSIVAADVRRLTCNRAKDGPAQVGRIVPDEPRMSKRCLNADAIKLRHRMIRRARTRAKLGRWWMRQCQVGRIVLDEPSSEISNVKCEIAAPDLQALPLSDRTNKKSAGAHSTQCEPPPQAI